MKEVKPEAKSGIDAFREQSKKDKEIMTEFMDKDYAKKADALRDRLLNHAVMVSGMYNISAEALNQCPGDKKLVSFQAACSFLASMEALGIITIV
jgi:hypothetical protein